MKSHVLLLSALLIVPVAFAQKEKKPSDLPEPTVLGSLISSKPRYTREMVLGNILKGALENMHLSNKQIDNALSENAFKVYLERLDYGKQFLLQSDVKSLQKYKREFDDMLISGNLTILETSSELMNKRIGEIEKHVETLLSKPLNYSKKESIETDPKKRTFLANEKELYAHWDRLMKYEVMSRIVDTKEEQNGLATDEKGNKKKPKSEKSYLKSRLKKTLAQKYLRVTKRFLLGSLMKSAQTNLISFTIQLQKFLIHIQITSSLKKKKTLTLICQGSLKGLALF